jgi:hypothetical protein
MPLSPTFDDVSSTTSPIEALPETVLTRYPGPWAVQGSGLFCWSVFRVYEATLFVQSPLKREVLDSQLAHGLDGWHPFVLLLSYLRNVTASQIVSASVNEMISLHDIDPIVATQWGEQLSAVLPDVHLGDRLIGLFEPGHGVSFFANDAFVGRVADERFTAAFAAIWLDSRTKAPGLRNALLGQKDEASR